MSSKAESDGTSKRACRGDVPGVGYWECGCPDCQALLTRLDILAAHFPKEFFREAADRMEAYLKSIDQVPPELDQPDLRIVGVSA